MGTLQKQQMTVPNSGVIWIAGGFTTNGAGDVTSRTPSDDFSFTVLESGGVYIVTFNKAFRQILAASGNFSSVNGNWMTSCSYSSGTTDTMTMEFNEEGDDTPNAPLVATVRFLVCARESGGPF
jgi:hypothetical protein